MKLNSGEYGSYNGPKASTNLHVESVPTDETFELYEMEQYPGTWVLKIGMYPAEVTVFMTREQVKRLISLDFSEQGSDLFNALWKD